MWKLPFVLLLGLSLLLSACGDSTTDPDPWEGLPDWTEPTHGSSAAPNFDVVFPNDTVQRLDLVIDPSDWQDMLDDMEDNYGPFGQGGFPPPPTDDNPIWAPCSVFHDGIEWYHVGLRFKGNSSLISAWRAGVGKLALKLDFDEFEDTWTEIDDQRFHGFKQLSLSNGFEDPSLMREHLAAGILREAGIPVAHTVPCRIFIDHGEGPLYFGLYTLVEIVDDTVIETQFTDGGNLYKPEGTGASFLEGEFNDNDFDKKSNEDSSDWSDILAIFEALNSNSRLSDPATWREGLEAVFDVDAYLRWLAVNTAIQNWDSYGRKTHNFYLYNDPSNAQVSWIPWDHNETLQDGKEGGAIALDFSDVEDGWPLINFMGEDEVYWDRYLTLLDEVIHSAFAPARMIPIYQATHAMIEPYVTGDEGEEDGYTFLFSDADFTVELGFLEGRVQDRYDLAAELLADKGH
jgi:spore coat protein H